MLNKKIKHFLDFHKIKYLLISHSPSYTLQEVAASCHISGKRMAKTVIIKIKDKLAMVVLPAHHHVNFAELEHITGSTDIDLARESEFKLKFPECEVGAMPPFGNLYGMPVYVSNRLTHDNIVFHSGSHVQLLQMSYQDFFDLVKPIVFTHLSHV